MSPFRGSLALYLPIEARFALRHTIHDWFGFRSAQTVLPSQASPETTQDGDRALPPVKTGRTTSMVMLATGPHALEGER
jgi:hypothetical protein